MKKGILQTLFGTFVFIASMVYFILSYMSSIYSDEWGTDRSPQKDYFILIIIGIIIIIGGIISIYDVAKKKKHIFAKPIAISLIGFIGLCYCLGSGIKIIGKQSNPAFYFILASISAFVLAFGILDFQEAKAKRSIK